MGQRIIISIRRLNVSHRVYPNYLIIIYLDLFYLMIIRVIDKD